MRRRINEVEFRYTEHDFFFLFHSTFEIREWRYFPFIFDWITNRIKNWKMSANRFYCNLNFLFWFLFLFLPPFCVYSHTLFPSDRKRIFFSFLCSRRVTHSNKKKKVIEDYIFTGIDFRFSISTIGTVRVQSACTSFPLIYLAWFFSRH